MAKHQPYMPGEIVVAMEIEVAKAGASAYLRDFKWPELFGQQNVKLITTLMTKDFGRTRSVSLAHLALPDGLDVFTAMKMLEGKSGILWSSPNFYYDGDPREIVPNDPQYASQYHHPLMKNNLAWDITLGSANIKIGIADDGVELAHTDLVANIWVNPGEIAGNGIDDDGNGFIDETLLTWTGNGNGNTWTDNANWDNGLAPQSCNKIVIPAGKTVLVPAGVNAVGRTLDVSTSAVLTVDPAATMLIIN